MSDLRAIYITIFFILFFWVLLVFGSLTLFRSNPLPCKNRLGWITTFREIPISLNLIYIKICRPDQCELSLEIQSFHLFISLSLFQSANSILNFFFWYCNIKLLICDNLDRYVFVLFVLGQSVLAEYNYFFLLWSQLLS